MRHKLPVFGHKLKNSSNNLIKYSTGNQEIIVIWIDLCIMNQQGKTTR